MKIHKSITMDQVIDAVQRANLGRDNPGFCNSCGEEADQCEQDMRKGQCEICGKNEVYGAEELLMYVT